MQQLGYEEALAKEAQQVLLHVDKVLPGQQRFAQLMEQLAALAPAREEEKAA
jgi:imidazoleglycerol phosphate synthase glutamine amidotransferase subunit HisH